MWLLLVTLTLIVILIVTTALKPVSDLVTGKKKSCCLLSLGKIGHNEIYGAELKPPCNCFVG